MFNSKVKQVLAIAIIAKGAYLITKKTIKKNKKNNINKFETELSKEDSLKLIEANLVEINQVYNNISPLFKTSVLDMSDLLNMNTAPISLFNAEEESFSTHEINTHTPEDNMTKAYSKVLFVSNDESIYSYITLRVTFENSVGYTDIVLYKCISKVIGDKNFIQIISHSSILVKHLKEQDIIELERFSDDKDGFSIKNKCSGYVLKTKKRDF